MRRARDLYASIGEHENPLVGFHRARRGKQDRRPVLAFAADLDAEIGALRGDLLAESVQARLPGQRPPAGRAFRAHLGGS